MLDRAVTVSSKTMLLGVLGLAEMTENELIKLMGANGDPTREIALLALRMDAEQIGQSIQWPVLVLKAYCRCGQGR
jgi:hypothetical protein